MSNPTHRFSDHASLPVTLVFALAITIMALFAITILLDHQQQPNLPLTLAILPLLFAATFFLLATLWSRKHPKLQLSQAGIRVFRLASRPIQIPWQTISSIDDIRTIPIQIGWPCRRFEIQWPGGTIRFGHTYTHFPDLITQLNAAIQQHHIQVRVRDYSPVALRDALTACKTPEQKQALQATGTIEIVPRLDPSAPAYSLWRFLLKGKKY